jgi:hypothetical protein
MWLYVHSTLSESYLAVVVLNWKILYARILVSMRNFLYLILWQFATELSRERFLFVETCMVKLLAIFVLHLLCPRLKSSAYRTCARAIWVILVSIWDTAL